MISRLICISIRAYDTDNSGLVAGVAWLPLCHLSCLSKQAMSKARRASEGHLLSDSCPAHSPAAAKLAESRWVGYGAAFAPASHAFERGFGLVQAVEAFDRVAACACFSYRDTLRDTRGHAL